MIDKRPISSDVLEALEPLPFELPAFEEASPPFSRGTRPEEYSESGLKKITARQTARTDKFLKYVLAIESLLEGPVPFVFKTSDGALRSLDAGCLGYCINRSEPYFEAVPNEHGFIEHISSTTACDPFRPLIAKLVTEIRSA